MPDIGTEGTPLRVAIVGSGPAGFYTAESLFNRDGLAVEVDMYERLPMPFGLVRYGVAPDHEKIKSVIRVFEKKTASHPAFRFFGNVDVGTDVTLDDLRRYYHAVCFASGAQTDRRMNIPGEDLTGSYAATEFVAWYNGHPDFTAGDFDLRRAKRVAVVGVGNVAVDVARILCRTPDELATTDIADYALEELRHSAVTDVHMLGRRGPTQAAFTNPEVRELGQMEDADLIVRPDEVELDPLSAAALEADPDRTTSKKVEILQGFARATPAGKRRRLMLRFLVSPVEILGDDEGRVRALRLVRNRLVRSDDGSLRPRATEEFEELPVDLVFRSVGYRGVAIAGLPFDESWGVVPNAAGRVVVPDQGDRPLPGAYVAGWIKRGPSGVIGTNKPDAVETVDTLLADLTRGDLNRPETTDRDAAERFVRERQPQLVTYADWQILHRLETERGELQGRPRIKITTRIEALAALGRG